MASTPTTDPREALTLEEACANGDGTFNGLRLLSWLSEAVSPGNGLTEAEVRQIASVVEARRG